MRQPTRIRRIAKWTGVCMFMLILTAWGFSLWYSAAGWLGHRGWFEISHSYVALGIMVPDEGRSTELKIWRCAWDGNYGMSILPFALVHGVVSSVAIPFWILLNAAAMPTIFLYFRDRRSIPPGHCLQCGYNLTGNASGVCPECGTSPCRLDLRP